MHAASKQPPDPSSFTKCCRPHSAQRGPPAPCPTRAASNTPPCPSPGLRPHPLSPNEPTARATRDVQPGGHSGAASCDLGCGLHHISQCESQHGSQRIVGQGTRAGDAEAETRAVGPGEAARGLSEPGPATGTPSPAGGLAPPSPTPSPLHGPLSRSRVPSSRGNCWMNALPRQWWVAGSGWQGARQHYAASPEQSKPQHPSATDSHRAPQPARPTAGRVPTSAGPIPPAGHPATDGQHTLRAGAREGAQPTPAEPGSARKPHRRLLAPGDAAFTRSSWGHNGQFGGAERTGVQSWPSGGQHRASRPLATHDPPLPCLHAHPAWTSTSLATLSENPASALGTRHHPLYRLEKTAALTPACAHPAGTGPQGTPSPRPRLKAAPLALSRPRPARIRLALDPREPPHPALTLELPPWLHPGASAWDMGPPAQPTAPPLISLSSSGWMTLTHITAHSETSPAKRPQPHCPGATMDPKSSPYGHPPGLIRHPGPAWAPSLAAAGASGGLRFRDGSCPPPTAPQCGARRSGPSPAGPPVTGRRLALPPHTPSHTHPGPVPSKLLRAPHSGSPHTLHPSLGRSSTPLRPEGSSEVSPVATARRLEAPLQARPAPKRRPPPLGLAVRSERRKGTARTKATAPET
nr:PREDICTED: translation initiation factor IF-2-like [Bos mutus]